MSAIRVKSISFQMSCFVFDGAHLKCPHFPGDVKVLQFAFCAPSKCFKVDFEIFNWFSFYFHLSVAVVFAFFVCWAPFHVQRLIGFYYQEQTYRTIYAIATYISGILYYLSTCINPLLYNIMSNKFREAFKVCEKHNM